MQTAGRGALRFAAGGTDPPPRARTRTPPGTPETRTKSDLRPAAPSRHKGGRPPAGPARYAIPEVLRCTICARAHSAVPSLIRRGRRSAHAAAASLPSSCVARRAVSPPDDRQGRGRRHQSAAETRKIPRLWIAGVGVRGVCVWVLPRGGRGGRDHVQSRAPRPGGRATRTSSAAARGCDPGRAPTAPDRPAHPAQPGRMRPGLRRAGLVHGQACIRVTIRVTALGARAPAGRGAGSRTSPPGT